VYKYQLPHFTFKYGFLDYPLSEICLHKSPLYNRQHASNREVMHKRYVYPLVSGKNPVSPMRFSHRREKCLNPLPASEIGVGSSERRVCKICGLYSIPLAYPLFS